MNYNTLFLNYESLPQPFNDNELVEHLKLLNEGNAIARKELIEHNIRLVVYIVKSRFLKSYSDLDELVCVGLIGLINGIDSFDITHNTKFATYISHCINNKILNFLKCNEKYNKVYSIDADKYEESKVSDYLKSEDDLTLNYEIKERNFIIRKIISELSPNKRKIVCLYFGFNAFEPVSQEMIAQQLNISQSYTSRVLRQSLQDINTKLKEYGLGDYSQKKCCLNLSYRR